MKILHVVGNEIDQGNGIGRLIPEMIEMHNKISPTLSASLLVLEGDYKNAIIPVYSAKQIDSFDRFFLKYDLVLFHGLYFFNYIKLYKILLKLNIPFLIKPHSSLMKEALKKSKLKKLLANTLYFKRFIEMSNGIIFTNEDEKINSINWGENTFYEPNGLNFNYHNPLDKVESCDKRKRYIYLSRIDFNHKGTDLLLKALEIIKERGLIDTIKLDIYGKGDKKYMDILESTLRSLDSPYIKFKGPVFGDDKIKAFKESDVFILTSRYEGFPMAILEALYFGIPCIVSAGANMTSILKKYNIGWLTPINAESIADNILYVNNISSEELKQKAELSHNYIKERHNWSVVTEISESIYKQVLGKI